MKLLPKPARGLYTTTHLPSWSQGSFSTKSRSWAQILFMWRTWCNNAFDLHPGKTELLLHEVRFFNIFMNARVCVLLDHICTHTFRAMYNNFMYLQVYVCIHVHMHMHMYLYLYTGLHSALKQERGGSLQQSPCNCGFNLLKPWLMRCSCVTEMDLVLPSGLFCVVLYNALGRRLEGILAKPVIKLWFTGVTEITHVDFSGEYAETRVGFALQTYLKSFLILTGIQGYCETVPFFFVKGSPHIWLWN